MRDDLLDAQACVDWPVSQFPSFQSRLTTWLNINVSVGVKELPADVPNNLIVAMEKEPFPLSFNVEAGVYLNAIRCSLDILATTLAVRYGIPDPDKIYFPLAKSAAHFAARNYKGREFVEGLPPAERKIIESLEPYEGGNKLLWSLHQLDIMRKHRRLLTVEVNPRNFAIWGWGKLDDYVTIVATGWMRATDQETVLALIKKGAPKPKMTLTPHVTINEPILGRKPVIAALNEFASLATSIIRKFDTT